MKNRFDIDKKYTWDLDVIYNDMNSFDKDYDKAKKLIKKLGSFEKKMIVNSSNFYKTIKLYFDIDRIVTKLSIYTSLSFDLDTSDNSKQELSEKVSNLRNDFSKCSYFIVPSILKLDNKTMKLFYKEEKLLKEYKCYIDEVYRYKKHTLGDNEEKIMSSMGKIIGTCYDTYELFKDCDMSFGNVIDSDGKEIELTNSNYSLFIESKDRKVRESAFNTLYSEYKKYTNTYASLIATNMKELSTLAKIYKYDTAIEMSLFGDDVSIDVYNNLIDSVHEKIGYIYEYYNLKKGILGLDELHLYDIYVPIVGEYDKKYEYEEAKDIIVKVLEVFGDEYVNKVKEGLDSRWIDVYPTKNKRTGGYSGGMYDTYPYILLNYQDKYNDMSTLIHEMGHSMHSYYSRNYNTYQNGEYRIFVAEVASTVNELLLSHYMLEHSNSKEEKLFILKLIDTALKSGDELRKKDADMNKLIRRYYKEEFAEEEQQTDSFVVELQIRRQIDASAEALSHELLYGKFLQGSTFIGVIGGTADFTCLKRITDYATLKYKRRFLLRQFPQEDDE